MPKDNAYLETVARLEPEITPIDLPAAAASIAISLRRIADVMEAQFTKQGSAEDPYSTTYDLLRQLSSQ